MPIDDDIRGALQDIKTDVRQGFSDVNVKIQELVTRGEFKATIERIDSEHNGLRREYDGHVKNAENFMQAARDADNKVVDDATKAINTVRTEVHTALEGYKVSTRWAITLSASVAGLIVAAASVAINLIGRIYGGP